MSKQYFDVHTHNNNISNGIYNLSLPQVLGEIALPEIPFFSAGIHPCSIDTALNAEDLNNFKPFFEKLFLSSKLMAIGECGFDKTATADFEKQKELFLWHFQMSELYHKPLIIHCVGYFNEITQLKIQLKPLQKWLIHGFRGKAPLALQLVKHGFYLSFGPLFNSESVRATPSNKLFCETDESNIAIETVYKNVALVKQINLNDSVQFFSLRAFVE